MDEVAADSEVDVGEEVVSVADVVTEVEAADVVTAVEAADAVVVSVVEAGVAMVEKEEERRLSMTLIEQQSNTRVKLK